MATGYVKALRTVQPQGPYLLGGWSFGGLVAFEMARQLWQQGERVALLALLDPPTPADPRPAIEIDDLLVVNLFIKDLQGRFGGVISARTEDELRLLNQDELLYYVLDIARSIKLVPPDAGLPQVRRLLHIFKRNTRVMLKYAPQPYSGNTILFRANEESIYGRQDPAAGWRDLATNIEVHLLPGNHYTLLKEPIVQSLTEQLKICLNKALADNTRA
jgi:thioesterase domain-containing protein